MNKYVFKKSLFLSLFLLLSHQVVFSNYPPIKDIINSFAGVSSTYEPREFCEGVKYIEVPAESGTYRFFGVDKKYQEKPEFNINFPVIKHNILKAINAPSGHVLQVVGDSDYFSQQGLKVGRELLAKCLAGNHVVEYGYTSRKKNGSETCVNGMVNEFIDQHPAEAPRVLANVLGQTVEALEKWGAWASSYVKNFVVVYNAGQSTESRPVYDKETGEQIAGYTTFGDDTPMSDDMCDALICQEGGAQSFRQVVNVLKRDVPVQLIFNARKPEKDLFSAARFLHLVRSAYEGGNPPSKEKVQEIFDTYVNSFGMKYVEKVQKWLPNIFNYDKEDWETKKPQFDKAAADFIDGEMYKKINKLCSFEDAQQ